MIVRLTHTAEQDLERIADYIALNNPDRALSFVRELRGKCEDLTTAPHRFPLVDRYTDHQVRRRLHGRYLIFYRVDRDAVTVLHILNGAQDYTAMIFDE